MNVKQKLTSVLSLTLALCMLLSTAAMALDSSGEAGTTDAGDSSFVESTSPEETDKAAEADSSASSGDADPVEPTDPADSIDSTAPADSTESPAQPDESDEATPDVMAAATGWTLTDQGKYAYYYLDDGATKLAGNGYTGTNYQVLYLPEQTISGTKFAAGYYAFQNGCWADTYTSSDAARYQNIDVIARTNNQSQVSTVYSYRMLSFTNGTGTLYSGSHTDSDGKKRRYDDGVGRNGYALGVDKPTPHLYYYVDGDYQTDTSKTKVTGYITYEGNGKLYYGSGSKYYAVLFSGRRTVNGSPCRYDEGVPRSGYGLGTDGNLYYYVNGYYQTSTSKTKVKGYITYEGKLYYGSGDKYYAAPFTGRRVENGVKRRYSKGLPYNGYGLGTESTPKLYYYVDGFYETETSKSKVTGLHKYSGNNKYYYGSGSTYNAPLFTGYLVVNSKLYKFTKGSAALFTGVYQNYYYSKGVKQAKSGWVTVGGNTYYFKSNKAVTGWQYLSRNSKTYKYYFKSDGTLVKDLFTYFGNSYLTKKMIIQVNRTTHTADILLYDSTKKSYCIAASSFVCSTSEKASDFKTGTYYLYSNRRKRWFTFTHPTTKKTTYYQYATFIVGTDAWIHSPQYTKKGDIRSLNVSNYNKLGTNQSFYCVRFQTLYSKRVYDAVGKQGSKKVRVKLYKSSNKGPYGQITLANSTGKLSKKTTYDPTDPAIK